jgi:hypothetical protein
MQGKDLELTEQLQEESVQLRRILNQMAGMEAGICVHILITEPHWDHQEMRNVKLIPYHKAGPLFPEQAIHLIAG